MTTSQGTETRTSYFHYFDFGFGNYIDDLLVRIRNEVYQQFMKEFSPTEADTILDVGVSAEDHVSSNHFEKKYPYIHQVTGLSVEDFSELEEQFPGFTFVKGDGRKLPFPAESFDYVYSHAVIEHVGSRNNQAAFISELYRVARKGVLFSTPNRWHPMESHTGLPLLHFLPAYIYRPLYRLLGKTMYCEEETLNLLSRPVLSQLCRKAQIPDRKASFAAVRWLGFPSNLTVSLKK